jgi:hypothetical protein
MKVMVIVKASKNSEAGQMPSTELLAAMGNFNQALIDAGIMLSGGGAASKFQRGSRSLLRKESHRHGWPFYPDEGTDRRLCRRRSIG